MGLVLERFREQPPDIQYMLLLSILPHIILLTIPLGKFLLAPRRGLDIFEPVFLTSGAALIGTTVRTFFMFLDYGNENRLWNIIGTYDPREIAGAGLVAINVALLVWALFYYLGKGSAMARSRRVVSADDFLRVIYWTVGLSLALNFVYLFQIDYFSNISSFGLSGKRFFAVEGDETNLTAYQYLKLGQDASSTAAILFACYYYGFDRSWRNFWILLGICLVAIMIPFVASIRGEIVYLAFAILVVRHYLYKRMRIAVLVTFLAASLALIAYMQTLRFEAYQRLTYGENYEVEQSIGIIQAVVYSAHFICVGKTSTIMANVPEEHPYLHGSSYLLTFLAPIPRVLWPEKPIVRIGTYVGTAYYDRDQKGGIPPGLIGEGWMNFGWLGVIGQVGFFGFLCGLAYRRQIIDRGDDIFRVGFYAILWVTMLDVFSGDVTGDAMRFLRYFIPYLVITRVARMQFPLRWRIPRIA